MSLRIGSGVLKALRASKALQTMLGCDGAGVNGRMFYVARKTADEQQDRIPYLIVLPQGITTEGNKDRFDITQIDTVDILCVAADGEQLAALTELVHLTFQNNIVGDDTYFVEDYTFSASAVQYDPDKPCFFQTLTYRITTTMQ